MYKGCFWIVLGSITFALIVLFAFIFQTRENWCPKLETAGDCQFYQDWTCYCIDETDTQNDTNDFYSLSQSRCQENNGSLATPDDNLVLAWLSKRMYFMGVDNAFVGLIKIAGQWYWEKPEARTAAENILWRPDFAADPEDNHGMVTVETLKKDGDEYLTYNYDHYIDDHPTYQWYGITTSDNLRNHYWGAYYICHYITQPQNAFQEQTTISPTISAFGDMCYCSSNEKLELSELGSSQVFTSPRYPMNYCSDHNCRWIISTQPSLVIKVEWIVLSLEKDMDFVYVFDGGTDDSPLVQTCTATKCDDRKSTGPEMQIHFWTDHVTTNLGFKAQVTAVKKDACYCNPAAKITLANVDDSYTISSPNYPQAYCPNLNCKWSLVAPKNLGFHLKFETFQLENQIDFLVIQGEGNGLIKNCTGKTCAGFISEKKEVHFTFRSDGKNSSDTGFQVVATVVKNYCVLHALSIGKGILSSDKELRNDGTVPVGTSLTLTCPHQHKVSNTVDDLFDTVTCISPHWNKQFGVCVPVCHLNYSTSYSATDVHFCSFGLNLATTLVENGHEVTMNRYDTMNGNRLIETNVHSCKDFAWSTQPSVCHPMGMVTLGGVISPILPLPTPQRSIEIFSPANSVSDSFF